MGAWWTSALSTFLLCFPYAHGKYVSGRLNTKEDWHFLTRFCYLSGSDSSRKGSLKFYVTFPVWKVFGNQFTLNTIFKVTNEDYLGLEMFLYYDDQWPRIYEAKTSCIQKKAVLQPENNQIVTFSPLHVWSGCKKVNISGTNYYQCKGERTFHSVRERWWFITLARCQRKQDLHPGIKVSYNLHLTNGLEGDFFHRELSADEFSILEVDISFVILFFVMCLVATLFAVMLRSRNLFHTTYKMFLFSLFFYTIYLLLMCVTYGKYAESGREQQSGKVIAHIFQAISMLTFQLLLILLGKGYTITRGRISQSGSIKIAVFMTVYIFIYVGIFIWEAEFFDPGKVLYRYQSPPGYGLVGMKIVGWIWFCYAILFTIKNYHSKTPFYMLFFLFYSVWFWSTTVTFLIAMHGMPWYLREKIVNGVDITIDFLAHLLFLFLTSPLLVNKVFPFHLRTTQIGPGSDAQYTVAVNGESELHSMDPYTITSHLGSGPNIANLFVVTHTETQKCSNVEETNRYPLSTAPPCYESLFQIRSNN